MNKMYIKVSDAKRIVVVAPSDSGVTATTTWENVSTEQQGIAFRAEYKYDGLDAGWKYCPYCGNTWKPTIHPTIEKCGCPEEYETLTSIEQLNNYIWDCLDDSMEVRIYHSNSDGGINVDSFSLNQ